MIYGNRYRIQLLPHQRWGNSRAAVHSASRDCSAVRSCHSIRIRSASRRSVELLQPRSASCGDDSVHWWTHKVVGNQSSHSGDPCSNADAGHSRPKQRRHVQPVAAAANDARGTGARCPAHRLRSSCRRGTRSKRPSWLDQRLLHQVRNDASVHAARDTAYWPTLRD